jgi:ATP-dependent Clp protease ATP-binding subunit ClpC
MGIDLDNLISEVSNSKERVKLDIIRSHDKLIGREKELNNIIEILLRRNKNNPLLIGEAGVGKSALVYELSRLIDEEKVPNKLIGYKIVNIDMSNMLSNTKYRGEFETKINNLIHTVKNKKIILFIDEIHTIVNSGGGESGIDASNILKPYLTNRSITVIGATTIKEYEKYIAPDKALSRRFAIINISEPNEKETINILTNIKSIYEEYHGYQISNDIIRKIVEYSNKYMKNRYNPDKSIEIMDVLLSKASISNKELIYLEKHDYNKAYKTRKITNTDLDEVIETLTNIHILKNNEIESLSKQINNYINEEDIKLILKSKSCTLSGNKSIIDNIVSTIVTNLKYKLLEIDMKDYTYSTSISRLIGTDPGYIGYNNFNILDKIKYEPYTLIYLKNYEYAHPNIKLLFKSICDNLSYRDINFSNSLIIIGESNNNSNIGFNNTCKDDKNIIIKLKEINNVMV